ncbi:ATP-binding protein [Massilimicrobiota sp. An134]|uniref:AlbA family DNA-binding domain-containing protein n=1 Tax=Massilimicrobiota sp. An134 TaxID=1965557 RepID=UPI000B37B252|nr:ATP-binding protein [Massilimicrobiota sp. An134]OUQ29774.1 hypothetical protein B5E79_05980 [Massilimicrobiota sp. An134]
MKIVTKDNINSILLAGESNTVEFKAMTRGAIKFLPRVISAFANTKGGVIILGYDEKNQSVIGTSMDEFEIIKRVISTNHLEDVCNAYIVQYEEKALIVIQVEKSKSIVIAGGGAYIREDDTNISVLTSKDVLSRIKSTIVSSETTPSAEVLERLEEKVGQIYDEMIHSQKVHEEELKVQKEENAKEKKIQNINNWFFCILSAVIGYVLGKLF